MEKEGYDFIRVVSNGFSFYVSYGRDGDAYNVLYCVEGNGERNCNFATVDRGSLHQFLFSLVLTALTELGRSGREAEVIYRGRVAEAVVERIKALVTRAV